MFDLAGGDQLAGRAELVEETLGVDAVPDADRVDDDRHAERLLGLLIGRALSDVAFVGVEDRAAQRVELLALLELSTDPAAELLSSRFETFWLLCSRGRVTFERMVPVWRAPAGFGGAIR